MTTIPNPPSEAALDRAGFVLWRHTLPAMPAARQKETWVWLPPAAKRQWIELAKEVVEALAEPLDPDTLSTTFTTAPDAPHS